MCAHSVYLHLPEIPAREVVAEGDDKSKDPTIIPIDETHNNKPAEEGTPLQKA